MAEVVRCFGVVEDARLRLEELLPQKAKLEVTIAGLENRMAEARKALRLQFDKMDMAAPGNFGWELRVLEFFAEFRRQVAESTRTEVRSKLAAELHQMAVKKDAGCLSAVVLADVATNLVEK